MNIILIIVSRQITIIFVEHLFP